MKKYIIISTLIFLILLFISSCKSSNNLNLQTETANFENSSESLSSAENLASASLAKINDIDDIEKNNMVFSDDGNFSLTYDYQEKEIKTGDTIKIKSIFKNLMNKDITLIYGGSLDGNIIYSGVCGINDTVSYPSASVEFVVKSNETITKTFDYTAKEKGEFFVYSEIRYYYADEFNQGIFNVHTLSVRKKLKII
ncbi:MAG TPA: hypothetical protein PLM59_07075 [Oscillospiraceae bacterium]|nr:hypothetical protein [Oscillospiraceae bacterium]